MKLKIEELAEIIDGDRGKNYPKQNEFYENGYCLFLNAGNVTQNGFAFENNYFITKEKDESLRKGKLQRGDIVYTTRGTVGNAALYSNNVEFENIRINSGMVILRCFAEVIDNRYLYQILKSEYYRPYFKKYCTGSAQPQLPIMNFSKIEINIHDLEIQRKIADILSAYDDLIENNQKQIKLLEEAAQRLYKEWFVDLHFPGYETTPIIDGVPEGWDIGFMCDIAVFQRGQTITQAQVIDGDIPVVAGGIEPAYYHNKANTVAPVVTVSASGANAGFTRLYNVDVFASDCSFVDSRATEYLYFVYGFLKNHKEVVKSLQKGSAQPHVYAKDINNIMVIIPEKQILSSYCNCIKLYFEKIKILQEQIKKFAEARDRLLPKLMSGELEV